MNCKKIYNFDFISEHCTSTFINKTLKVHRENVLFDREKSLLPETQPYVVLEKQRIEFRREIDEIEKKKYILRAQIEKHDRAINDIYVKLNTNQVPRAATIAKEFVHKCPIPDCRGFLSTQWKCGVCDTFICKSCNEQKDENHECDPVNVASMELIKRDSKSCPECGTVIHRYEGCPQMFCVNCHTGWNWNTGQVVKGVIHNPHYYDFIRTNGQIRRTEENECGQTVLPDLYSVRALCNVVHIGSDQVKIVFNIHNTLTHITHHVLRHYQNNRGENFNRDLRVRYLMNSLSEDDFKAILQKNERTDRKMSDFQSIYRMFIDVGTDIFRQFIRERVVHMNVLFNLTSYFNENLKKLGQRYKCVYGGFNTEYNYVNNIVTNP